MAGWFAGRLAPAPVSQSRAPLVADAPDSGHGRNDMVSNPVPDFGFSGFQSSNDVHIDYECLSHLKWATLNQMCRISSGRDFSCTSNDYVARRHSFHGNVI